jgi:hypothetical protein
MKAPKANAEAERQEATEIDAYAEDGLVCIAVTTESGQKHYYLELEDALELTDAIAEAIEDAEDEELEDIEDAEAEGEGV